MLKEWLMPKIVLIVVGVSINIWLDSARAESTSTITGSCNTVVGANNKANVAIECSDIPPEIASQIAKLLNLLLNQQLQASDVVAKLDNLYDFLRDLNERDRRSHVTLLQRISLKTHQCNENLEDLRARTEQKERPGSDTFQVNEIPDDLMIRLRAAIGSDKTDALVRLETAHRRVEPALLDYLSASARVTGLDQALLQDQQMPGSSAGDVVLERMKRSADTAAMSAGRQVVNEFVSLCQAFSEVETLCTSDLCTK